MNCCLSDSDKNELIGDVFDRVILRGLPIDSEAERMIGSFVQAATALRNSLMMRIGRERGASVSVQINRNA